MDDHADCEERHSCAWDFVEVVGELRPEAVQNGDRAEGKARYGDEEVTQAEGEDVELVVDDEGRKGEDNGTDSH